MDFPSFLRERLAPAKWAAALVAASRGWLITPDGHRGATGKAMPPGPLHRALGCAPTDGSTVGPSPPSREGPPDVVGRAQAT